MHYNDTEVIQKCDQIYVWNISIEKGYGWKTINDAFGIQNIISSLVVSQYLISFLVPRRLLLFGHYTLALDLGCPHGGDLAGLSARHPLLLLLSGTGSKGVVPLIKSSPSGVIIRGPTSMGGPPDPLLPCTPIRVPLHVSDCAWARLSPWRHWYLSRFSIRASI